MAQDLWTWTQYFFPFGSSKECLQQCPSVPSIMSWKLISSRKLKFYKQINVALKRCLASWNLAGRFAVEVEGVHYGLCSTKGGGHILGDVIKTVFKFKLIKKGEFANGE